MSDMEEKNIDGLDIGEVEHTVVITPEDVNGAVEFWNQYNIPMSQSLTDAIANFNKSQTLETQKALKLQILNAIATTKHEAFEDELFTDIIVEGRKHVYESAFEEQLEKILSADSETDTTKA